jgi:ATP-binding cassette, subfamily B, bacterial
MGQADEHWIGAAAVKLGLEVEAVEMAYSGVERQIVLLGPALLRLPEKEEGRFLALLGGSRKVRLLGPDLAVRHFPVEQIRAALCHGAEVHLLSEVNRLLLDAGVPKRQQPRARRAILHQRLGTTRIGHCWLIRLPPGASFWRQVRQARLPSCFTGLAIAHGLQFSLWLLAWWMVGEGALQGRLDHGWLLAWVLLLLSLVPLRVLTTWLEGVLAIGAGVLLKQRLLYGALQLEPEEIRHQGAGQLLGRVIESEAVESLALSGGLLGLVSGIELVLAAGVLGVGAGGWPHAVLLVSWVATAALLMGWRYFRRYRLWTDARLGMTHDLVESLVGHRTRLAQQAPGRWHEGEDQALERYLNLSREVDQAGVWLLVLVPRAWLIIGMLGLLPAFVSGSASPAVLAVGIGGILLAHRALRRLSVGLQHLVGAGVSWKQAALLFQAAGRSQPTKAALISFQSSPPPPPPTLQGERIPRGMAERVRGAIGHNQPGQSNEKSVLLEIHNAIFRYPQRSEPALRGCNLRIEEGDRLLLEGPSGGGKSTLASLLTGLRAPQSGLLLAGGLDRQTLGAEGWQQRVSAAPQFHENHVLTGTFSFNLLMARCWPPRLEDLEEAETLCRELGLDELLRRMPAGLLQMVGETGWQLSHGERSRLFIARALLQGSDLVVLDESFASLDPENLNRALSCVLSRARTLFVIAHP